MLEIIYCHFHDHHTRLLKNRISSMLQKLKIVARCNLLGLGLFILLILLKRSVSEAALFPSLGVAEPNQKGD